MGDTKAVKELFENTDLYLTYDYNLRIRQETVEEFTKGLELASVLDVPCGTGSISAPLLKRCGQLTLVDISSNMLAIAARNVSEADKHKVIFINKDIFDTDLPANSYDLVICLGLLAHIGSPEQLLKKIISLVKPGGLLILQNTNSKHFYSHLIGLYLGFKSLLGKQPYKLNKVPAKLIDEIAVSHNLQLLKCYRYNQSFLGFSNLFSNEKKYSLTCGFFGTAAKPKNQSWGSDYTYLFRK